MPQSLSSVYLHLVFSTKDREAFLRDAGLRQEMHAYLGEVSRRLECPPVAVGGVEDHVHILARFGRGMDQAGWVKELKRVSSSWMKEREGGVSRFSWQAGYGVFSVSRSKLEQVERYVINQEAHHRRVSFQDEFRELLKKHEVEFDERYLWD